MIFKKFFILVFVVLVFTSASYSQIIIPDKVKQGIVIDHSSGAVLAEKNADQKISPASMTKIMTAVVVFDQLKNKKIKLTDQFTVSVNSLALVNAGGNQTACDIVLVTLVATGALTYTWNNGVVNNVPFPATISGVYTVTGTDVNGCTNISNTVTIKDSASGKCFIYPNPTSGKFQVRYYSVANNVLPRTLTIFDAKGDRVFTQYYTIGRPYDRMDVDMRAYGKGLYWVEIGDLNGNRITMCRVVIQ